MCGDPQFPLPANPHKLWARGKKMFRNNFEKNTLSSTNGRRVAATILWGLATALLATQTCRAQSPIVIQFSHVVAADTAKGKAAIRFKELAESRTQGRVRVEVYPNSELYKDREELDALKLGAVQMLSLIHI
jgi:TRAP-type C4-dicarboxylate transport system substrate-binding protein